MTKHQRPKDPMGAINAYQIAAVRRAAAGRPASDVLRCLTVFAITAITAITAGSAAAQSTPQQTTASQPSPGQQAAGATVVTFYGYDDCLRLQNETTRVTLCPAAGGRVLEYAQQGRNVLYLPPGDEGWVWQAGGTRGTMNAGRFDIGPEFLVPKRDVLWMGRWSGEITGPRSARLTSQADAATGVQLIRDFELAPQGSHLRCTQTIRNLSQTDRDYCHWSRTFAVGDGIAIVPRAQPQRFPQGYVMYGPGTVIDFQPQDPNVLVDAAAVTVVGPPQFPKLGFDSHAGWLAYLTPGDLMFVKRFATYPERAYNEVAALTVSVWYPASDRVELEPIGPAERLAPGESASFSEHWWLLEHPFPDDRRQVDFQQVQRAVQQQTRPPTP